jgi:GxxExxY protein
MHEVNQLTEAIIGLAIEVHRHLGPGLSEAAYERALCIELTEAGLPFHRQIGIPVVYKGEVVAEYRPDLVVAQLVVVDVKSVERLIAVHAAQMLTYLRVTGCELGLLLNFNEPVLKTGIRRVILQRGERTL